jgi:NDP-sugar pyrophosphorylase family protein
MVQQVNTSVVRLEQLPAVLLVGGMGTRLRPAIGDLPKALAPVRGQPFLAYQLRLLRSQGIRDVVLCVGYRRELIENCFGNGAAWGVRIRYAREETPLGTGGALRQAVALLAEIGLSGPLLAMNGDTFFDAPMDELLAAHRQAGAPATVALIQVPNAGRYGAVTLDGDGRVSRFAEKSESGPGLINAGAYILEPAAFRALPGDMRSSIPLSLESQVFPHLVARRLLYGYLLEGYNIDIGTPESYAAFEAYLAGQPADAAWAAAGPAEHTGQGDCR